MLHSLQRTTLISFYVLAFQTVCSVAFSWHLNAPPRQCSNLSVTITGTDGVPPYHLLIVPSGPTPLPNNTEVRQVIDQPFDGTSLSLAINYPANSAFVAVVSDARGFGTGGTSAATQVSGSGDSSCFSLTNYSPPFFYFIDGDNQLTQCQASRIWWHAGSVQGTPSFLGIIPGGQSFALQESAITNSSTEGTGFSWTPKIRGGTTLIIVASDNRGIGTGGSALFTVQLQNDGSCLNGQNPSSTPGTPAGIYSTGTPVGTYSTKTPAGTYSTSTPVSSSSSSSSAASSAGGGIETARLIGTIVGGAVGGFILLIGLILLTYCLRRVRNPRPNSKNQPMVDVLEVDPITAIGTRGYASNGTRDNVFSQYSPEPFITGQSSQNTETGSTRSAIPRLASRPSGLTDASSASSPWAGGPHFVHREPGNHSLSMGSSSTSQANQGRGMDIFQHQDAGLILLPPVEEQRVELPPRYSDNLRPMRFSDTASSSKGTR